MAAKVLMRGSLLGTARAIGVRWAAADRVALAGMLLVVVPVTAALFPTMACAVVPPTLLMALGYWWLGNRLRTDFALVPYAFFGGALAGYLNTTGALHCFLWLSGEFRALPVAGVYSLLLGFLGSFHGVGYGLMLLPPLWLARRARRYHAAEATDRVLAGTGLWGLAALAITALLAPHIAIRLDFEWAPVEPGQLEGLAAAAFALMLASGVARWRERRAWLARVRQGKVPGWLVLPPDHFGARLDELPLFCPRLLGRDRDVGLVLAECGPHKGTYRSDGPVPRFRVA